ncbi:MAG: hypothetical protein J6T73_03430 [Clostridia bacterium]|nr:hypothetical protein [Clostridia bacterium]
METERIVVTSEGFRFDEALAVTENLGNKAGLDKKSVLHLRLLAEELFGMLRGIAGEVEANYWIENDEKNFEIHMKSEVNVTDEMRKQFLSAASSGKNAAAAGFMGKIRVMIADTLLTAKEALPYAMINAAAAYTGGGNYEEAAYVWTMSSYRDEIQRNIEKSKEASKAWDELEKSIVANIADDIKVSIAGKKVDITVYKAF